jgi:hypothetical protein
MYHVYSWVLFEKSKLVLDKSILHFTLNEDEASYTLKLKYELHLANSS